MKTLYLDHAATSPPLPEALEAFRNVAENYFANPGSLHRAGANAARSLEKSRKAILHAFGGNNYTATWTATGTESNHLAIQGLARTQQKTTKEPTILVGAAEHPAASMAAKALQEEGFVVKSIPVTKEGLIEPEMLANMLNPNVVLITVQWVNNELGSLNPITRLVQEARKKCNALFHVDAIQAVGKRQEWLDDIDADAISAASHKIGGVRGCAALFLHKRCPQPKPIFTGGGHEQGIRAGTENVMGAAAFAEAARICRQRLKKDKNRYHKKRLHLLKKICDAQPNAILLGPKNPKKTQGGILTMAFPNLKAEPLLHQFEEKNIQVGTGSACNAKGHTSSPVLSAINLEENLRNSVIRFSLDGTESEKDLDRVAEVLLHAH